MTQFDNLTQDIGARFNLGPKAGPLIQELLRLIAGPPEGVAGFLNKFRTAGLASEVDSWLGRSDSAPLSPPQVEQALGRSVGEIAGKLGLNREVVATAIGYIAPKMIGMMTPGGIIPTSIPAWASRFSQPAAPGSSSRISEFSTERARQTSLGQANRGQASEDISRRNRWLMPAAAALVAIGALGYLMSGRTGDQAAIQPSPSSTAMAPAASIPARLALVNDNGLVVFSGVVRDGAARGAIMDSLKRAFGADKISGDLTVDGRAYPATWVNNLKAALDNFKTPGAQALFEGNKLSVGGPISDSERNRIVNALKSVMGTQYAFATLSDGAAAKGSALSALKPGFTGAELVGVLNQSNFDFPTNSAELPASAKPILQQAASLMKQLPAGTLVQIGGYRDSAVESATNMQLSQQRADAVRQALVEGGVNPSMLRAKGLGVANGGAMEGRSSDAGRMRASRSIEFSIVQ
ncbi:OmpA family protein [Methylocapsa aurea]|uniref:OmpA family protein n=1 Tax=Methylocapsa aurea TaxID=663610 RepID=UPI00056AA1AD|nr:OmpA family protein [Methylocapsa aurea]